MKVSMRREAESMSYSEWETRYCLRYNIHLSVIEVHFKKYMKQVENNKTKEHKNNNGGNNNFIYIIKAYSKHISVFSAILYGIAMGMLNVRIK